MKTSEPVGYASAKIISIIAGSLSWFNVRKSGQSDRYVKTRRIKSLQYIYVYITVIENFTIFS
jgi:hypothetical protein